MTLIDCLGFHLLPQQRFHSVHVVIGCIWSPKKFEGCHDIPGNKLKL